MFQAQAEVSHYTEFSEQTLNGNGLFVWRHHSEECDVFVMSDIDRKTGAIRYQSPVHVTATYLQGTVLYNCTCSLFRWSSSNSASQVVHSCPHVRLLEESIQPYLDDVSSESLIIHRTLKAAHDDKPVVTIAVDNLVVSANDIMLNKLRSPFSRV